MSRTSLNYVLGGVLASLIAVNWLCARDYSRPNYEFLPNMAHAPRYNAYEPNPTFADGRTLQAPPPGTIPHGATTFPYRGTPEDAAKAGEELRNPFDVADAAVLARGAVLFNRFCLPCHGSSGAGDGPVARRGFPPPPALSADHARLMKDGQLYHVITLGQGNMPSHAAQIDPDDRWRIVARIRQLQEQAAAPAVKTP